MITCRQILNITRLKFVSYFSTSECLKINDKHLIRERNQKWRLYQRNQKWRENRGFPLEPNHEPKLRDLPDFTYLDGRPTPYGARHIRRIEKQREYTAKIIHLTAEIDRGLDLYNKKEADKQTVINQRMKKKLTEKGKKIIDS